tara:strand:+ start:111 stop:710 length:600 start_codon:yes stop_codon:yes gene_type:complete
MAIADNPYSRFVNWSKIILPLAAIALLSTLFMFAKGRGGETTIPFAEIEAIAREPRLSGPQFSGMAEDGSVITVSAGSARQDMTQREITRVEDLTARIDSTDGTRLDLRSTLAEIDLAQKIATLSGLAQVDTSSGYAMETSGLIADFNSGTITSTGPLEVRAPFGTLKAAEMVISTAQDGAGQQMVFKGGVSLLYLPQQ